jgi:hypothetical protein
MELGTSSITNSGEPSRLHTYRRRAIMADLHKLLIHKLHTTQAWLLKQPDLRLYQQIERNLRHEQARARAGRVADRGANVLVLQVLGGVDGREGMAEHVRKNVVDARATRELLGGDLDVRALN